MAIHIIENREQLNAYISENGDYDANLAYLSKNNSNGECFVITGCTYASEAFAVVGDENSLVVTDENYQHQIDKQLNSEFPEFEGFQLKTSKEG